MNFIIPERGDVEVHRSDDSFLLRFLRARQFHGERAYRLVSFNGCNSFLFFILCITLNRKYDALIKQSKINDEILEANVDM